MLVPTLVAFTMAQWDTAYVRMERELTIRVVAYVRDSKGSCNILSLPPFTHTTTPPPRSLLLIPISCKRGNSIITPLTMIDDDTRLGMLGV